MQRTIAIGVVLLAVVIPSSLVHASQKAYQTGKLVSVYSPEVQFPLPTTSGQTLNVPMHLVYEFEVQEGDTLYKGYCQPSEYKPEWKAGDDVQFRLKQNKIYLKRPNGKELRLVFLMQAKLGVDGKPVTILKSNKR
jgi:hypothetical protein